MNSQHTIVYVMRHIDIGENVDIPYKKIGITGSGDATLTNRLRQISNTKSPIQAQCIIAWEHSDARVIENALHQVLEDSRVLGEWFLDKNDTLVERLSPIMALLGAKKLTINDENDSYTKSILNQENKSNVSFNQKLLGEISELLEKPLRSSLRLAGPTVFGDKSKLTFYIDSRKSGNHKLYIGRSKKVFEQLKVFLEEKGFDCEHSTNEEEAVIYGLSTLQISEVINHAESEFKV